MAGDSGCLGLAAVPPPVRDALAAAVSIRGAARASPPAAWFARSSIGASGGLVWLATWVDEGVVKSVSVVVEVERLLEEDGSAGAEKVLDTAEWTDSCESGKSGLCRAGIDGVGAVSGASAGTMDM